MPGRGRGRGRGRGAGGGSRGRRATTRAAHRSANAAQSQPQEETSVDFIDTPFAFFTDVVSVEKHAEAQETQPNRYAAVIAVMVNDGVELAANSRARALAVAWAKKRFDLADSLLTLRTQFGLPEVLKALEMLDAARKIRVQERKLKQAQVSAEQRQTKLKKSTLSRAKNVTDNLENNRLPSHLGGSVSGALSKRVREWVRHFTKEELEFFALHFPVKPWQQLADLVHLNPEKDFPQLPWFLRYVYGGDSQIPADSFVQTAKTITEENVNEVLKTISVPYSHVRPFRDQLTSESKAAIARNENKLARLIWWYERLGCPEVDAIIMERLANEQQVDLNYGKLMERLLTFHLMDVDAKPPFFDRLMGVAEEKLSGTQLALDSPIAVIADASSSMNVAIRTATIIASLFAAFTSAKMVFFNNNYWMPDKVPTTTQEVFDLALGTRASGCTAHAAGLWPFYERKEQVRTFFVVTDEEENTSYQNTRFLELYQRYCTEVYQARLVFISFLRQTSPGQMVQQLRQAGHSPMQFRMDGTRPDLSKLDSILGQLAAHSEDFGDRLQQMQEQIESRGIRQVFSEVAEKMSAAHDDD